MLIDGPTVSELTSYREAGISLCLRRETDGPGLIKAVVRASAMPGIDLTHRATIPVAIGHNGHRQGDLFNNDPAGVGTLNSREIEILDAIARGFSNKTIGSHFGISDQTVKNRLTGILRKLHATDRTEAVVIAFRRGWLDVVGFKGSETLPVVSNDQP
ncbi:MAG: response regulator transcription factor [Chloroflexi bacterium]|nr:response regulator transcription factor [Chloroflexota bacterium]